VGAPERVSQAGVLAWSVWVGYERAEQVAAQADEGPAGEAVERPGIGAAGDCEGGERLGRIPARGPRGELERRWVGGGFAQERAEELLVVPGSLAGTPRLLLGVAVGGGDGDFVDVGVDGFAHVH
jgi:hypothetical protein